VPRASVIGRQQADIRVLSCQETSAVPLSVDKAKELEKLWVAIGEFIYEYSQLEFAIRIALAEALPLGEEWEVFDAVTSPYDFTTLCRVTRTVLEINLGPPDQDEQKREAQKAKKEEIERIFKACMAMNNDRVRIAHGTWGIWTGARNVSRETLKAKWHFEEPEKIVEKAREIGELIDSVLRFVPSRGGQL
jgi:hypothetical protein